MWPATQSPPQRQRSGGFVDRKRSTRQAWVRLIDSNEAAQSLSPPPRQAKWVFRDGPSWGYQMKTRTSLSRDSSECPLSGEGRGSGNFLFHLVFFPAAFFLSGEEFRVVTVVAWLTAIERGVVNLLPYPSLPGDDFWSAVVASVHVVNDHFFFSLGLQPPEIFARCKGATSAGHPYAWIWSSCFR